MITTIHHNLPLTVSKQIIKSMIGSLNATAIAYARGHLRYNAIENIADRKGNDVPTIDDYNDAKAANDVAQAAGEYAHLMGFDAPMSNAELCDRLMAIRNYLADRLNNLVAQGLVQKNDMPLTIAETVKFQTQRKEDPNVDLVEALALAVDIDPEMLKAAKIKMIEDDHADLVKNAAKIVSYLSDLAGAILEHDQVEELFNGLPAHVQYKIVGAGIRAHDKANQRALQSLLRGKLDAASDIKMLKASKEILMLWIKTFSITHRSALNAYLERGGMLPEFETGEIVTRETETKVTPAPVALAQQIDEGDGVKPTPAHVEALIEKFKPADAPGTKAKRVSKKKQAEIQTTA